MLVLFLIYVVLCTSQVSVDEYGNLDSVVNQDDVIPRLQQYLQIQSVQPDVDYSKPVEFLKNDMENRIGLETTVLEFVEGKKMLVGLWRGKNQDLKAMLLTSHMDVVPVNKEKWKFDPFEAHIEDGMIYARGTQDMKSQGMTYLESVNYLKNIKGVEPDRNVYILFTCDEEIGSHGCAEELAKSEFLKKMNVGFGFDEGCTYNGEDKIPISVAEKSPTWVRFIAEGPGGHGSKPLADTATVKLTKLLYDLNMFRDGQIRTMNLNENFGMQDIITMNVDVINAGVKCEKQDCKDDYCKVCTDKYSVNVIPTIATALVDFRVPPTISIEKVENILNELSEKHNVTYEYVQVFRDAKVAKTDDYDVFDRLSKTLREIIGQYEKKELGINPEILYCATDSRYLRRAGLNMYGITSMGFGEEGKKIPHAFHKENEFITVKAYLQGIDYFSKLIENMASDESKW